MEGMTVETYNTDNKGMTNAEEVVYTPPQAEVNPHPRGTTKYYQTKMRLNTKQLIKAKLFIDNNIDRLETAMEEDKIKEQDYITTMDTMMIIKRITLPQQQFSIDFIKMINKPLEEKDIRMMEHSQSMFNKLWMGIPSGRASDWTASEGKNCFFNIKHIAGMWDYMEWIKAKNAIQKDAPIIMAFMPEAVKTYKEVLSKWEREFIHPIQRIINKYK
jgi:hypothetical protein